MTAPQKARIKKSTQEQFSSKITKCSQAFFAQKSTLLVFYETVLLWDRQSYSFASSFRKLLKFISNLIFAFFRTGRLENDQLVVDNTKYNLEKELVCYRLEGDNLQGFGSYGLSEIVFGEYELRGDCTSPHFNALFKLNVDYSEMRFLFGVSLDLHSNKGTIFSGQHRSKTLSLVEQLLFFAETKQRKVTIYCVECSQW